MLKQIRLNEKLFKETKIIPIKKRMLKILSLGNRTQIESTEDNQKLYCFKFYNNDNKMLPSMALPLLLPLNKIHPIYMFNFASKNTRLTHFSPALYFI